MFASPLDPISQVLANMHAELDDLDQVALFPLSDAEIEARHASAARLVNRLVELTLRLVTESEHRGLDTKAVMVRRTQQDAGSAARQVKLAAALDSEFSATRSAMASGDVSEAQAAVIVHAVKAIPVGRPEHPGIGPEVPARAERALVGLAAEHTPKELRELGRRILDVVAPDLADEVLGAALQREHDQALRDCHLTLTDDDRGRTHLRGVVPASVGAMIRRNLQALMAPKHLRATATGPGDPGKLLRRPSPERWGHAFCEYVERYPIKRLPASGGVQARAMVTLDHEQLLGSLSASGVATIDGTLIPAGEARRLACEAAILPAVLGGRSKPLDLGRSRRFHDTGQRLVMDHRDKTCTADGCDWPSWLCHAHHDLAWSRGGGTSVDAGRLLCPRHHQLAHHPRWEMSKAKHARVVFRRM